ncbi:MAG: DJ-1/PfpI family protein, partial [Bdellovibrionales bacterium]|nr:DJ-1/PfpI family protein [Ramlibacter sp.]
MDTLPEPLPRAIAQVAAPEVLKSPPLSLLHRPGDASLAGRKVAILVAPGVEGEFVTKAQAALLAQGVAARLVGPRIGRMPTASGGALNAGASIENEPGFLFDALIIADGEEAVATLSQDGHTMEFIKDQFRHCKTIMAIGAAGELLSMAGLPVSLDKSLLQGGTGLIVAEADEADEAIKAFIAAMGKHRHFGREMDPPAL